MAARINRNFLEQTSFDSGMPVGLGMLVHSFQEPGEYEVSFARDDQVIERVPLIVAEERGDDEESRSKWPRPEQGAEPPPLHVTIELGQARRAVLERPLGELEQPYLVRADGYTAFTAARREDTATIVVRKKDAKDKGEPFDSRRLGSGDIFAVTLVRPGTYSLKNALAGAEGRIRVTYPKVGKERYHPPPPVPVECTDGGFNPGAIDLKPAQGIIFRIQTLSRIQIDLVEPDDGPEGPRPPKVRGWRKSELGK